MQVFDFDNLILNERIFGLEIIDNSVKVLELKKSGGKFVTVGLGQEAIEPIWIKDDVIVDPEAVAGAVRKARNTARPHRVRSRYASVFLPDSKIFVRVVKFPAKMSKEEIREAVQWKAKDLIAMPLENVYWDWHRLSKDEVKGEVEVVISSVEKKAADSYTKMFKYLNIIPLYYDLSGNAAARFLFQKEYNEKRALLVRIDSTTTTLNLFLDGGVRYQTILTDPAKAGYITLRDQAAAKLGVDKEEAEHLILYPKNLNNEQQEILKPDFELFFNALLKEVRQVLEYYNQTLAPSTKEGKKKPLDGIFLYGRGAKVYYIEEFFAQNNLELRTKIKSSSSLSPIIQFISRQSLLENLAILGLSLRNLGLFRELRDINLVPNRIKKRYLQRSVYSSLYSNLRIVFWSTFIIALTISSAYVMTLIYKANVNRELESVRNLVESQANQRLQEEIDYVNQTATQIDLLLSTQLDWDKFYEEISSRRGNGITYSNILITEDETVWKGVSGQKRISIREDQRFLIIGGTAQDRDDLQLYATYMEESDLFENVKMPISNFEQSSNIDFNLYCLLNTNELRTE